MGALTNWMDQKLYPRFGKNWDNQLFRERILTHIDQQSAISNQQSAISILDLGAGAGIIEQMNFKGIAGRICGIDPDPRVTTNPFLDEGKEAMGENIPYADASFDLVFSVNVLEHLEQPEKVFAEVQRVLKPGGVLLVKTPNKWHYMPLVASLTPHGFHQWFNQKRGRSSDDTFPTRYRANSPAALARLARATGLEVVKADVIEGRPEYMRLFALTYLFGWLYERAVNHVPGLGRFGILLIGELRKPQG